MSPAVLGLQIVAWIIVPYALTSTLAQILFASGNQALDLRVNLIAVTANTLANLPVIPRFGFIGAATTSLLAACLQVSLQYRYVRRRVFDPAVLAKLGRIAGAGLASLAILELLAAYHPILATALGISCYVLALWSLGVVERRHLSAAWANGSQAVRRIVARLASMMRSNGNLTARQPPVAK
jgi:O-antigen/teichoic acid export membrane protein